jgi:hypothetical protein
MQNSKHSHVEWVLNTAYAMEVANEPEPTQVWSPNWYGSGSGWPPCFGGHGQSNVSNVEK